MNNMLNFAYKNPTEILFGEKQINEARNRIPDNAKVLFLYGGGSIKKNGIYDDVINLLDGLDVTEFSGVEANPSYETLIKAVDLAKQKSIDFILAVGGGSVIDGGKFIAAAVNYAGDPWEILAKGGEVKSALPLGCVLTLPATGSESNGNSVVTRKSTQQKLPFTSPLVQPLFAVLDPVYTYSLPEKQISNGVVDAFVHVIEQYLTYPVNAPLQDRFAEGILQTLIEQGPKALVNPQDYDTRANIMWSATMALNGLIGQGVPQDWSTHMIGHELTALYHLDHAQTLAVVLPSLMYVQRDKKAEKIKQLGQRVFAINESDDAAQIDKTIQAVQNFFEQMKVKTRLADYELTENAITEIVANLEKNGMTQLGEHQDIDLSKVSSILKLAL